MHDASVETEESHAGKVLLRFLLLKEQFDCISIIFTSFIFYYDSFYILDHGTRGTNTFSQRADGNLSTQRKVTISIPYQIKIGRKIRSDKLRFNKLFNFI